MWIIRPLKQIQKSSFYLLIKAVLFQEIWLFHKELNGQNLPRAGRMNQKFLWDYMAYSYLNLLLWNISSASHVNHFSGIKWYSGITALVSILSWLNKYIIFSDSPGFLHSTFGELMSPTPQCQVVSVVISCFQRNLRLEQQKRQVDLVVKLGRQVYSRGSNTALSMQEESFIVLCVTSTLHKLATHLIPRDVCWINEQYAAFSLRSFSHSCISLACYWGPYQCGVPGLRCDMLFLRNYRVFPSLRQERVADRDQWH